jgi:16S rRNA G966 N2-methylase RsmD
MDEQRKAIPVSKPKKLSTLKSDPRNANRGTKAGRKALDESLRDLGMGRSILIDKDGVVIAGNKTMEAALKANPDAKVRIIETDGTEVIAVQRKDLTLATDAVAKRLAVADNRVSELDLAWDMDVLGAIGQEADISSLFSDDELSARAGSSLSSDLDEAPALPAEPVSRRGDIYQLGRHRLMCGDALADVDVDALLGRVKPRMVYTDPPYGIKATHADGKVGHGGFDPGDKRGRFYDTKTYAPIIGDDTIRTAVGAYKLCARRRIPVMIFWGGNHYSEALPSSSCWLVWDKKNAGNDFADAELAWTNQKTAVRIFQHMWNGMLKDSERGQPRVHPTQKPVALADWCFRQYGKDKDAVLDLFGGSGSTLIACEKSGRDGYIMELDPGYCDVIVARWEKATGAKAECITRGPEPQASTETA